MPLVTEDWAQYEFQRGVRGRRHFIITGVANALEAEGFLLAHKGIAAGVIHDLDARLRAQQPDISHPKGPNYWEASVEFLPVTAGTVTGSKLDLPIEWEWRSAARDEPTDVDAEGTPILTSAGFPFSTDHTRPFAVRYLVARRWESNYRADIAQQFELHYNQSQITIPRAGTVAPGRIALLTYEPVTSYNVNTTEIECAYTFELRAGWHQDADGHWDGFKFRIRDEGYMGWYDNSGLKPGNFIDPQKAYPSSPVLLDGSGKPWDTNFKIEGDRSAVQYQTLADHLKETTGNVTFLKYKKFAPINFNGLGLF